MHGFSMRRLTAFIVSLGACLALAGSPALYSAPGMAAAKTSPRGIDSKGAPAAAATTAKLSRVGKAPAPKPRTHSGVSAKRTNGASQVSVSGTTTDGSGHGWPLYTSLTYTSDSTEPQTVFSDPVTGQYQALLFDGIEYTVVVASVARGYMPTGTTFTTEGTPIVQDWALEVDAVACNAVGYFLSVDGLQENFDSGVIPEGWTVTNLSEDGGFPWYVWEGADPCGAFPGNDTGGTGPYALVNSNCDGFVTDDTALITPSIDLSEVPSPILRFAQEYVNLGDTADVDVSNDGGTTWNNVLSQNATIIGPNTQQIDISEIAGGQANVQVRWNYYNAFWAWWWQVDNVIVGVANCLPNTGGLIVGNVYDGNTGAGINKATVANNSQGTSTSTFDPGDPAREPGFYMMFSPAGPQDLEASANNYASDAHTTTAFNNDAVRRDFTLQAGMLSSSPSPVSAVIPPNGLSDKVMTLSNTGQPSVDFEILEVNAPLNVSLTAGFAPKALVRQAIGRLPKDSKGRPQGNARSAQGLAPLTGAQNLRTMPSHLTAGGTVTGSFPTNIAYGWGVGTAGSSVWLSNLAVAGGDDLDYEYVGGELSGATIDDSEFLGSGSWAADGAFNQFTGTIWRVKVAGDDCLHEIDPATHSVTGNTICGPWTAISQRGVAYDASTDTYYVGGWNEGVVYHIDTDGNIIDSSFVAIAISGLAFNPNNGHLLAMENGPNAVDVWVLDALNNYAVLDQFQILDNGTPVFNAFEQAGMEFDCLGNLWVVNQISQMLYSVATDESVTCQVDIPWLTVDPTSGSVAGTGGGGATTGTMPINLSFNSSGMMPGLRQAQLQYSSNTPYAVPGTPVALTVLFNDVPENSFAWNFIYGAAGASIMFGGPPVCSDIYSFCPNGIVTRADMAGYIFRAVHGPTTPPPVYTNIFTDVTFNQYNSFYIQGIYDDGITAGCNVEGTAFCPDSINTRAQMSVFIWKGEHGSDPPPPCTEKGAVFGDVPCGSFAADYIYGLYNEGVTAGCGSGNFCPSNNISNAQMAVFIVKGFGIPYLP